ncbi:RNA polymerase sigma factor [Dictyobacter aurantiacus]|uniref:RNA polymerase sigma24 factor n=1 Tax=Dictyobacter aurantiacus TaxID=1936993 RepID=A0A401ZJ75_9CHLR|nr:RNA polymerase sigma factor [Dictyobacter aurantiacus]GCE06911.1 RNA polymerase sigma24 factor [Dictyobacter aurantiacus]
MELSHKVAADGSPVGRLYEQHGPALFAYLSQQTGSREAAEDVLVEVFMAALETERFVRMSEKEQVSWLWRVTRNKAVDAYRRSQVRRGLDLSLVADYIDDKERSPELIMLQREESTLLQTYLDRLSPGQRRAIQLRFAHGLRSSEIATLMGKREGSVRSLMARALNFLRTLYDKEQEEAHL